MIAKSVSQEERIVLEGERRVLFRPAVLFNLRLRLLPLLAFLSLFLGKGDAFHRYGEGVNSNFLIERNRVCFAQSDLSLTLLNLETGAVLARADKEDDYGSHISLYSVQAGILAAGDRVLRLLDRETLKEIWRVSDTCIDVRDVRDDRAISIDGGRQIVCRSLTSRKTLWTYAISGYCGIVEIEKERVLLYRAATVEPETSPEVVLLEQRTGQELWRRNPPPGLHFLGAYFDGQQIHVAAGQLPTNSGKKGSSTGESRVVPFEMVQVWDLSGNLIQTIPAPPELRERSFDSEAAFRVANRYYAHGRIWATADAVPRGDIGKPSKMTSRH